MRPFKERHAAIRSPVHWLHKNRAPDGYSEIHRIIKITLDAREVAKDMHKVKMMLLLISAGEEGKNYCQSCLQIRTVMVLDGKVTVDNCQANFPEALEQISDLITHGVRYSEAKSTLLGQCAAAKGRGRKSQTRESIMSTNRK